MSVNKGDLIDEAKRFDESCRLLAEIVEGGGGFEKIVCCGNDLTAVDVVDPAPEVERFASEEIGPGLVIDEEKNYPGSCGLKVKVIGGGAGLTAIHCCGNTLTPAKDSI